VLAGSARHWNFEIRGVVRRDRRLRWSAIPGTNASSNTLLTCGACDVRSATDARNQWPIRLGMDSELSPLKYVVETAIFIHYR
jgi:hypothetical protein